MVRVLTRLGEVKKDLEKYRDELVDFKLGEVSGKLRAIVADETVEVKSGEAKPIKIKKISIPGSHIIYMCGYATNRLGHTIAAGEETPLPISMDRTADYTTFVVALSGTIQKNDLLGVAILLPVDLIH